MGKLKFFNEVREALRFLRPGNEANGKVHVPTKTALPGLLSA